MSPNPSPKQGRAIHPRHEWMGLSGSFIVIYRPHNDRLTGRSVPCANLLAALQELFATNTEVDPFILDFHYYNDDDEQEEKLY